MQIVVFRIENIRQAIPLESLQRIVHAVEVTPVPGAPAALVGMIDVAGQILPVFGLRERLRLNPRAVRPHDCFLLVQTRWRLLAIVADETEGVVSCELPTPLERESAASLRGVVSIDIAEGGSLLLIHDMELFLSADERQAVEHSLSRVA